MAPCAAEVVRRKLLKALIVLSCNRSKKSFDGLPREHVCRTRAPRLIEITVPCATLHSTLCSPQGISDIVFFTNFGVRNVVSILNKQERLMTVYIHLVDIQNLNKCNIDEILSNLFQIRLRITAIF